MTALALSGALTSTIGMADTTLYGSLRAEIDYTNLKPGSYPAAGMRKAGPNGDYQDSWGLWDAGSRWRIKGSELLVL